MRAVGWQVLSLAVLLVACSSDSEKKKAPTRVSQTPVAGQDARGERSASSKSKASSDAPPLGELVEGMTVAALTRATVCEDLLKRIQDDVAAKVSLRAELARKAQSTGQVDRGFMNGGFAGSGGFLTGSGGSGASATPSSGMPPALPAGGSSADAPSSEPTSHSETNVQVAGIDEADIVKTDGEHIYLLHGNELFVLESWPAAETSVTGSIHIDGSALELFVRDRMAVVFSDVYDQGELIDAPSGDGQSRAGYPYYGAAFTKITLIDTKPATPKVRRELFIEGSYLSARRHDKTVRAVIQGGFRVPPLYGPSIEYVDAWGREHPQSAIDEQVDVWRDRTIASVRNTELGDWLPIERERKDGELTKPTYRCGDFYLPPAGLTDYGLTNIVSFSIDDPRSKLGGAVVLGAADDVYSNETTLLLVHRDWRWQQQLIETDRSALHRFELDGDSTTYTASGFVPGHIVDQFAIDERDGVIRISTTSQRWPDFVAPVPAIAEAAAADDQNDDVPARRTDNRVLTLSVEDGDLKRRGISEPLGKDGEIIYSTRFVGDRGYVVTFERRDPLIVLDLSDPKSPTVLGQLDIPGFSQYMHPLDANHLLTIGRDADDSGVARGLLLQIFDVSDPTQPQLNHTYSFAPDGYSQASENHKAFTFYRPEGFPADEGLLAFPYVDNNYDGTSSFRSVLEVFKVSASNGMQLLGEPDHTAELVSLCNGGVDVAPADAIYFPYCVEPEVRRGLFIFGDEGDYVYSISNASVLVHELGDLVEPVASVPLPLPDSSQPGDFGGGIGGRGVVGGSGGTGGFLAAPVGGTGGIGGGAARAGAGGSAAP